MIPNWIKQLFVKTSPVQPEPVVEVVAKKPRRKQQKTKQAVAIVPKPQQPEPVSPEVASPAQPEKNPRGRPFGSRNKGPIVSKLKKRPKIRKGERLTNFRTRVMRWEARNDSAKIKGDKNKLGQSAGDMANSN
jgi:hypothetical protein